MGKLVVGILAVILLQIAFFGYTSRYWSAPKESILARARPPLPELDRVMDRPQVSPPSSPDTQLPESAPAPRLESPPVVQRARPRTIPTKKERVRKENIRVPLPERTRPENPQLSAVAPRRYTVVVTDDLAKFSTANPSDIPKPRKRSFLAKSFSVVVKKPWGWVKSLASKLN